MGCTVSKKACGPVCVPKSNIVSSSHVTKHATSQTSLSTHFHKAGRLDASDGKSTEALAGSRYLGDTDSRAASKQTQQMIEVVDGSKQSIVKDSIGSSTLSSKKVRRSPGNKKETVESDGTSRSAGPHDPKTKDITSAKGDGSSRGTLQYTKKHLKVKAEPGLAISHFGATETCVAQSSNKDHVTLSQATPLESATHVKIQIMGENKSSERCIRILKERTAVNAAIHKTENTSQRGVCPAMSYSESVELPELSDHAHKFEALQLSGTKKSTERCIRILRLRDNLLFTCEHLALPCGISTCSEIFDLANKGQMWIVKKSIVQLLREKAEVRISRSELAK